MRCPKCGYNSFDHLDSCKKCGKDLIEHKQRFGIVSVLFPGQMKPVDTGIAAVDDSDMVDAAVAAATAPVATAAAAAATVAAAGAGVAGSASESDDFGFDFMGDSEEEEDLSFDELFEEAPVDEDVEETLPAPESEQADRDNEGGADFSFDLDSDEDAAGSELEDDFGFDPAEDPLETSGSAEGPAEDLATDDFELPPAEKDDFSFDADNIEFEETADDGTEGDPKSPFDLPESSQDEGAPEHNLDQLITEPAAAVVDIDDNDLLLATPLPADSLPDESPEEVVLAEAAPAERATAFESLPESSPQAADPVVLEEVGLRPVLGADMVPSVSGAVDGAPLESVAGFAEEELSPVLLVDDSATLEMTDLGYQADAAEELPAAQLEVASSKADSGEQGVTDILSAPDPIGAESLAPGVAVQSLAAEEEVDSELDARSFPATGRRIAAFCCDLLLLFVVGTSFVIAAEAAISTSTEGVLPSMATLVDLSVPYFLVLFSLAFAYFTLFHFLVGQTPGKMLVGLRVETVAGEPLLFSQAFLRSVGGLLQLLPAGLGFLFVLLSPDRRGWNDRLAGTRLISIRGLSEEV